MKRIAFNLITKIAMRLVESIDRLANWKFYNYPLGKEPRCNAKEYQIIWEEAKNKKYEVIDQYEKELGYAIDPKWFHELALLTQIVKKNRIYVISTVG